MFKKHILLLILSLLSIQIFVASGPDGSEPAKSIFSDVKYFECIRESSKRPLFIKIDTKEQYIKLLGLGALFDKEWSDNDLWITAKDYSLSINSKFSFNQLSGDASLTAGRDIDEYSGCKAIEPLLD